MGGLRRYRLFFLLRRLAVLGGMFCCAAGLMCLSAAEGAEGFEGAEGSGDSRRTGTEGLVLVERFRAGEGTPQGRADMVASLVQGILVGRSDMTVLEEINPVHGRLIAGELDAGLGELRWRVTGRFSELRGADGGGQSGEAVSGEPPPSAVRLSLSLVDSRTGIIVAALAAETPTQDLYEQTVKLTELLIASLTAAQEGSTRENVELLLLQGRTGEAVNRYLLGLGIEKIAANPGLEDRLLAELAKPYWRRLGGNPFSRGDWWTRLVYTVLDPDSRAKRGELSRLVEQGRREAARERLDLLSEGSGQEGVPFQAVRLRMAREAAQMDLTPGELDELKEIIDETLRRLQEERFALAGEAFRREKDSRALYYIEEILLEEPLHEGALALRRRIGLRRRGRLKEEGWEVSRPEAVEAVVMPRNRLSLQASSGTWRDPEFLGMPEDQTISAQGCYRRWYDLGLPLHAFWEAGGRVSNLPGYSLEAAGGLGLRWYRLSCSLGGTADAVLGGDGAAAAALGGGLRVEADWLVRDPLWAGAFWETSLLWDPAVGTGSRNRLGLKVSLEW